MVGSGLILVFDGTCREGNPGVAGSGIAVFERELEVYSAWARRSGRLTNNESEYKALIFGLESCLERDWGGIHVVGDSQLVIRQMQGKYAVHADNLRPLWEKASELAALVDVKTFTWIPREDSRAQRADQLANRALDLCQSR